jgi:Mrp family chromosome partitioning ATPase
MKDSSVELAQFEPTVFGAIRRFRFMVLVFALAGTLAALGYTVYAGKSYEAKGQLTVPLPASSAQNQDSAQYLDSQTLLLQSPAVAQKAASIADATLHSNTLSASNFSSGGSLGLTLPVAAAPGSYGSTIIGVTFTASNPTVAQAGANATLQAFVDVRSANISSQYTSAIAGINNAIENTTNKTQQAALGAQLTQLQANEQLDLAQQPTVILATAPTSPATGSKKKAAIIGLVIGFLLGAVAAYVRAGRRRGFADRRDPAALYSAPLVGEIPAFETKRPGRSNGIAPPGLPMSADPRSAAAEAFRFAAGSVKRIRDEGGPRQALVFLSPLADVGKSMVIANLALAIAEGGTRVLAVDANADGGDLTARLLPGSAGAGLEQVLAGQQPLASCIQLSPLNDEVAVLGSGPALQRRVTGAARATAMRAMLATVKSTYDVVLIDSPALLQVADATELVSACDAAIVVLSPNQLVSDHIEMMDRLRLIGADVVGYIYNRAPMPSSLARHQRNGSSAHPIDLRAAATPVPSGIRLFEGASSPSSELTRE